MTDGGPVRVALSHSRLIVAALVGGVLVLLALSGLVPSRGALGFLALPAGLLGLVSPVIGYKLYSTRRDGIAPQADLSARCRSFVMATVLAMAVTEGAAFVGILVFMLSGEWTALAGVLTHVLLAGAIWPSADRLQPFLGTTAPSEQSG